jgi:hypothetical protein
MSQHDALKWSFSNWDGVEDEGVADARPGGPEIPRRRTLGTVQAAQQSLAALDIVRIPSAIIEPAIAATIIYVAVENFFSRDVQRRWRIRFASA